MASAFALAAVLEGVEDVFRRNNFDGITKGFNEFAKGSRTKAFNKSFDLGKEMFDGVQVR